MTIFFDTSALIKNYIEEPGSLEVEKFLHDAQEVLVSTLTLVECFSTLRRIQLEGGITREEYLLLKKEISHDFSFFSAIDPSDVLSLCESLIDSHLLKTLDSIQLASALACKASINRFVCSDLKLSRAAEREGLPVSVP